MNIVAVVQLFPVVSKVHNNVTESTGAQLGLKQLQISTTCTGIEYDLRV